MATATSSTPYDLSALGAEIRILFTKQENNLKKGFSETKSEFGATTKGISSLNNTVTRHFKIQNDFLTKQFNSIKKQLTNVTNKSKIPNVEKSTVSTKIPEFEKRITNDLLIIKKNVIILKTMLRKNLSLSGQKRTSSDINRELIQKERERFKKDKKPQPDMHVHNMLSRIYAKVKNFDIEKVTTAMSDWARRIFWGGVIGYVIADNIKTIMAPFKEQFEKYDTDFKDLKKDIKEFRGDWTGTKEWLQGVKDFWTKGTPQEITGRIIETLVVDWKKIGEVFSSIIFTKELYKEIAQGIVNALKGETAWDTMTNLLKVGGGMAVTTSAWWAVKKWFGIGGGKVSAAGAAGTATKLSKFGTFGKIAAVVAALGAVVAGSSALGMKQENKEEKKPEEKKPEGKLGKIIENIGGDLKEIKDQQEQFLHPNDQRIEELNINIEKTDELLKAVTANKNIMGTALAANSAYAFGPEVFAWAKRWAEKEAKGYHSLGPAIQQLLAKKMAEEMAAEFGESNLIARYRVRERPRDMSHKKFEKLVKGTRGKPGIGRLELVFEKNPEIEKQLAMEKAADRELKQASRQLAQSAGKKGVGRLAWQGAKRFGSFFIPGLNFVSLASLPLEAAFLGYEIKKSIMLEKSRKRQTAELEKLEIARQIAHTGRAITIKASGISPEQQEGFLKRSNYIDTQQRFDELLYYYLTELPYNPEYEGTILNQRAGNDLKSLWLITAKNKGKTAAEANSLYEKYIDKKEEYNENRIHKKKKYIESISNAWQEQFDKNELAIYVKEGGKILQHPNAGPMRDEQLANQELIKNTSLSDLLIERESLKYSQKILEGLKKQLEEQEERAKKTEVQLNESASLLEKLNKTIVASNEVYATGILLAAQGYSNASTSIQSLAQLLANNQSNIS